MAPMATPWKNTAVLDGLLNYCLFAPLTLIFWYGTGILFEVLVLDGESTDPLQRAIVAMVVSSAFEVFVALAQRRLTELSHDLRDRCGYGPYFLVTRLYNYLMGLADVFLCMAIQTFYTEYVGPVGPEVHGRWAVAVLAVVLALRISRTLVSSPFFVDLDHSLEEEDEWFDFRLHFKTTPSSEFVLRLYDAIFSVFVVSLLVASYWFTLTFTFDGLICPSDFVKATAVSCAVGYAIVGLAKYLTPLASAASARLERKGRTVEKLVVEDGFLFATNFGTILLWKGLTMFAQLLSETLGPVFGVSPHTMAIVDQLLAFLAMSTLGVSSLLVFKGPLTDGELTNGQGLQFPTHYLTPQPQRTERSS